MDEYFDIYGTPIPLSTIKDFRIIQREYIYRPAYIAAEKSILNTLSGKKYTFWGMQPYAAILDEKGYNSSTAEYKAKDFKESVGKDLAVGAVTAIADKFNIKALKYKKYVCVNQAGRIFTTYLEDIPALIKNAEGKASDVYKDDELYRLLGEPIAPAINMVHALLINTKEASYVFYGNGIQLEDVGKEYERLKFVMSEYQAKIKKDKTSKGIGALGQISFPKLGKKTGKENVAQIEQKKTESELATLKSKYASGELTEAEYLKSVDEILERL